MYRSQKFLKYHQVGLSAPSFTTDSAPKPPGLYALIYADRDCQAGQQLFESYGDNDNTIFLHYHGFIPLKNPYDYYEVWHLQELDQ